MKRALIITCDKFPRGNAGATRQEILAKLFFETGYSVDLIGLGASTRYQYVDLCEGIRYISLRNTKQNLFTRIVDRVLFAKRAIKECDNSISKYDAILIEAVPRAVIKYVKKYAKKNGTILIHDSVEWYSASEYKLGKLSPAYLVKDMLNRRWITSDFRVIAISNFLKEHFVSKGCKCVRIPFIHDVQGVEPEKKVTDDKIVFVYAGMMGYKDHLRTFLEAVSRLDKVSRQRIDIRLFGPTREYMIETKNADDSLLEELGDCVEFFGRVSRETVEKNLLMADFALLFRNPDERYAKAGFPTKVVESLMYATPMLCNLSSDLGLYLRDGVNCMLAQSESTEDICDALQRILKLTLEERIEMQKSARKCATENFDYRIYRDTFFEIICEEK